MKKLYKSNNRMICGVCAGIAEYLGIDPTVVRLLWAALGLTGTGMTWSANGEVSKAPMVVKVENGAYVTL